MTTTRETADHAELARLAEAATKGEWSIDGYQCVCAPDGQIVADYSCCGRGEWEADAAYILAAQPSRVLALLSEIAALRAVDEEGEVLRQAQRDSLTQAERQRDEARAVLTDIRDVPYTEQEWPRSRALNFLANQGADQ